MPGPQGFLSCPRPLPGRARRRNIWSMRHSPRWASSSRRLTAWAGQPLQAFQTWRGRTLAMPVPRSHSVAQSHQCEESVLRHHARRDLTEVRQEAELDGGLLLFHPEFYKAAVSGRAVTTTAWIRSRGRAVDELAGRPQYSARRTWTTPISFVAPLLLSASSLPTSTRRRDAGGQRAAQGEQEFEMLMIPGAAMELGTGPPTDARRLFRAPTSRRGPLTGTVSRLPPAPTGTGGVRSGTEGSAFAIRCRCRRRSGPSISTCRGLARV